MNKRQKQPMTTLLITAAVLAVTLPDLAGAADVVEWVWTEDCNPPNTTTISCGGHGAFHFFTSGTPRGCSRKGGGQETPAKYPPPVEGEQFPMYVGGERGRMTPAQSPRGLQTPWIGVIDFDSAHGSSVWWLAQEIAGETAKAELSFVDSADLVQKLGAEIGDLHLLGALCKLAEEVEVGGRIPPVAVNLSLGRLAGAGEDLDYKKCSEGRILCQISLVIQRLRDLGTHFIASSGNLRETLVPGALTNVAATGAIDLTRMLDTGSAKPSWESPSGAAGYFPANGLCLRGGFSAAAGSSYASSFLTGWISSALAETPSLDPLDGRTWSPAWSPTESCFVLAADDVAETRCNDGIDELMEELSAASANVCWNQPGEAVTHIVGPLSRPENQPEWPSYDEWIQVNHPTPESDPCIPCTGWPEPTATPGPGDVLINLSRSNRLPEDQHLHHVYLRVGDDFYPLGVETVLDQLESGDIDQLLLVDWGDVIDVSTAASLVYVMSDADATICQEDSSCYWKSSPVLWRPEP